MSVMDAAACRAGLARLIEEETGALEELAGMLDLEHEHLLANDVTALQEAMRARQGSVTRILRVDEERRVLCRTLGRPDSLAGLTQLMQWCDPQRQLAGAWQRCAAAADRARQRNDRNGAMVGARLKHVQERLNTLFDSRRSLQIYGRRGGFQPAADAGSLVAAEA